MKLLRNNFRTNHASLISMLAWLTLMVVAAQIILFIIHYQVGDLVDSLVASSLPTFFFHAVIILPIIGFILLQIICYLLWISWTWFIATSCGALFKLSSVTTYFLGLFFWLIGLLGIFALNNYYFPDSFFAGLFRQATGLSNSGNTVIILVTATILITATLLAYLNLFLTPNQQKKQTILGSLFLFLSLCAFACSIKENFFSAPPIGKNLSHPNIIFIGLDSLRPDFVSYYGNQTIHTPNIDAFLRPATQFTDAYSPLARTFPAWISILTAKYPKHSQARNNLMDPNTIIKNDNLAKHLKNLGYETIYATDEKRFSNITTAYGFDQIIGPHMGINDFILGGLNDFPLTNLLINTAVGKFLFPFNFGNRAAAITYEPDNFLQLVKSGLANRSGKPLFLAIHLCLSHWPFTWARDNQPDDFIEAQRYQSSVERIDQQLGELLQILKNNGLLENSLVVLLSDHGVTVGLPHDRVIDTKNYVGARDNLTWLTRFKLASTSKSSVISYSLNTSYGQGTDVLSLKQYHIILAFRGFGIQTRAQSVNQLSSLLDITPTILDFLHQLPLRSVDGISFAANLVNPAKNVTTSSRPFYLENGYSIPGIETDTVSVNKVINQSIKAYQVNAAGLLFVKPSAEKQLVQNKQLAILQGDWLLAKYPASVREKMVQLNSGQYHLQLYQLPAFFVLVNLKTGQWSADRKVSLMAAAPTKELYGELAQFYGDEIKQ